LEALGRRRDELKARVWFGWGAEPRLDPSGGDAALTAGDREEEAIMSNPAVKISCRNIWKIYGTDPKAYFTDGSGAVGDPEALRQRMRAEDNVVAASDVSFDVHVGEIFIIMGLSGSGKSTMVRCLSRLVEPTAGEVLLDGSDLLKASDAELIDIRRHKMGMVFQNFGLLPHLTVLENVAFPLKAWPVPRKWWIWSASRAARPPFPSSFPAGSNSVSASPARWRSSPSFGSWMSPSPRLTP
jgi:ABC-type multidrug transport system fused ATPase/permease subunit